VSGEPHSKSEPITGTARRLDPDGRELSRTFTRKADENLSLAPSQEAEPRSWSRSATTATAYASTTTQETPTSHRSQSACGQPLRTRPNLTASSGPQFRLG
jgi:hypothetical protein